MKIKQWDDVQVFIDPALDPPDKTAVTVVNSRGVHLYALPATVADWIEGFRPYVERRLARLMQIVDAYRTPRPTRHRRKHNGRWHKLRR